MTPIPIGPTTHVLVLTGAGISAESGVPTFRGAGGLWEGHAVEEVASPEGFFADPLLVWRFYSQRRAGMERVIPNPAHHALVALENRIGDRFLLATQNVDGLHAAAGSQRLVEMHGNLMTSRCTVCDRPPFDDRTAYADGVVPMCGVCEAEGRAALLRPHIVWFGEMLDERQMMRIEAFVRKGRHELVFVAIGTSGMVWPAAGMVDQVAAVGGRSWLINAELPANANRFDQIAIGPAGALVPALLA